MLEAGDVVTHTVYALLTDGAQRQPDQDLVLFESGERWTWSRCLAEGQRAATALSAHGVAVGDRVIILLPNGPGWLRAWWGSTLLGAVVVPVNPAYQGLLLADVCTLIEPTVIVAEADAAGRLPEEFRPRVLTADRLVHDELWSGIPDPLPKASDIHCLLMTSGTTGPSKASITTNAFACHLGGYLIDDCGAGPHDVFLADMPWFHLSSFGPAIQMMRVAGKIALRRTPAIGDYWATAKEMGATFAIAPGTVAQMLEIQPPSALDRDHTLRFLLSSRCLPIRRRSPRGSASKASPPPTGARRRTSAWWLHSA